ncbi:phosphate transporter [Tanticharoenia sakaeratensis NBRC 103193]|uniref:Phosphate transporter n=2 Tax=Tanticharoenia TaxID=444052 RepID=A0A0D6MKT5_9PROT|nr:phosphate transporter [Tanticharoenia sakaeratensis NBRC 103193]GBQ23769.1 low-affinity phosphate transport protein [Tanticharoenia sakaeratensis NBRC 103193]
MPKDERFIEYFCAHAKLIVAAATEFSRLMSNDGQGQRHIAEINRLENEADAITRQTVLDIHRTFITPFDRSQILDLITALDDTIDLMKDTCRRMTLYGVAFTPEMRAMAECSERASSLISDAMPLLRTIDRNAEALGKMSVAVRACESEADDMLDRGLRALFASDLPAGDKLIVEKVYDLVEAVVDRCEDIVDVIDSLLIASALGGAIFWNILTWRLGIPSSSSHALVGGLIGAGIAKAGFSAVIWGGFATVASAIVLSPLAGVIAAMALVLVVSWLCVRTLPFTADRRFRKLQFVSSALLSLAHGGNDAQKTMGIITVLLYARGMMSGPFHVPLWVVLSCQTAMALGTLCGGWKIVRTMGTSITHLTPMQGFGAETGAAAALFTATWAGIPVSTTHTITGAIVGVGAARRISAVRWGVARRIVIAWCVTLPAAATVGAGCYWITRLIFG